MEISTFVNITVNTEMVIITKTTTKQQYLYFVLFFENAHAGGGGRYDVVITVDGAYSCARLWVQIALMSYYQQQQIRTTIRIRIIITFTTLPLIGDIYVFKKSCLQYLKYIEVMLKSDRMRHKGSSLSTLI